MAKHANIVEQDHRVVKRVTHPMLGCTVLVVSRAQDLFTLSQYLDSLPEKDLPVCQSEPTGLLNGCCDRDTSKLPRFLVQRFAVR